VRKAAGFRPWWEGTSGYQIYIRSFADSNGDGIGDLGGIRQRLDYLVGLGVDFIWITPFYPSPMADWGYDVADYCGIDPRFGTLDDFDLLIVEAHSRNLRLLIDLVPNHSSSEHPWFRDALSGPDSDHRDYYIWADPGSGGGPPNNWVAYFGGPAWTLDQSSGQYYMHLFLPEQPDLNWRNPAVADEFDDILRFWLERGVDGFRIDVAGALIKDSQLRSNPEIGPWDPTTGRFEQWLAFEHRYDVFQPESHEVFRRWRAIVDDYDAYLLGETYNRNPQGLADLLPGDGMHGGFWFEPMHINWVTDELRRALVAPTDLLGERLLWAAGSHDMPRAPTRFGGGNLGRERTLALNVLFSCLPGVPILYQGEELGLVDGQVPSDAMLDPVDNGRDGCRTPMPWTPGPANGFTTGDPWLRSSSRVDGETAENQVGDPDSWYALYARLLAARWLLPDLVNTPVVWIDDGHGPVISYQRGPVAVAANTSGRPETVATPASAEVVYTTPGVISNTSGCLDLPAHGAAVWVGKA
jgi:alpha-glucosidase